MLNAKDRHLIRELADGEKVVIRPPSDTWAAKFRKEKAVLAAAMHARTTQIEHIGSTAVRGLSAKPIVDIAVKLPSVKAVPRLVGPLAAVGYTYAGEYGLPGRHFFIKGKPREFHLHLVDGSTDHWDRWLIFRNLLRRSPQLRKKYEDLKKDLARKYADQRPKYTAAKSAFVDALVEPRLKAREQRGYGVGLPAASCWQGPKFRLLSLDPESLPDPRAG
jgi:GrpB-like predicted nucleotidyltransferase (UPF0157 family)